ncbi:exosortase F system-associated membrane protein [Cochleicola gelatinilyticus]|uniref:Exosortase F system-associated protein n=1 Tax=Cochleicola gelatinilyticus TaxID=1763537 RepID=A0A167ILJ5_9FLAO|nr:exosortase F system-associated protein [Cochleicola gelatinilyticus]OAB79793.1 hypothetical protein ULVI_03345 [Cochleicola gelatinilyticus]
MNKILKIGFLALLGFGFLVIRMFEESLFYDPLLAFFRSDYSQQSLPDMNTFKLIANIGFRFFLNTVLSLAVLFVLFQKKGILLFSVVMYILFFGVLLLLFLFFLFTSETGEYMALFYIRRFLIQPILLLLLVPAFYFQLSKK